MRLQARPLNALAETAFLTLSVEALHSVLDLVYGLLLAVESFDADQVEHISDECALDRHVERGLGRQGRRQVDFKEPRLEVRVDEDVEAEHLEAVRAVCRILLHR